MKHNDYTFRILESLNHIILDIEYVQPVKINKYEKA